MPALRLLIVGSTGEVGRLAVARCRARGHTPVVLSRSAAKAKELFGADVETIAGDLTDAKLIEDAVAGVDGVVSCVGMRIANFMPWTAPMDAEAFDALAANLGKALAKHPKKTVILSSTGVGKAWDNIGFGYKVFFTVSALRNVFPRLIKLEESVQASGADVLIVHPPILSDEPKEPTGKAHVVPYLWTFPEMIPRVDVADWMVEQVAALGPFKENYVYLSSL